VNKQGLFLSPMVDNFSFTLEATCSVTGARAGVLHTPHGEIKTPVFMPVGTQATVKTMSPAALKQAQAQIILANTYHLHLRPGSELVAQAGGLHRFESWDRPILTDSGGYQVFSLRDISTISDDGVAFRSHIDGSKHLFSPRTVIEIQRRLGADIIMMFDECPPSDAQLPQISAAVDRTIGWAQQCAEAFEATHCAHGYQQALFPIVQGGVDMAQRQRCVEALRKIPSVGYAIGGLAVGEPNEQLYAISRQTAALLPADKPRYLMGVGMPQDLLQCVRGGCDMFDCVIPTRHGRNASVFTHQGRINLRNAKHRSDFSTPLDPQCNCWVCKEFSRGYIHHLHKSSEILGIHLMTYHNIAFFISLMQGMRDAILQGSFSQYYSRMYEQLGPINKVINSSSKNQ